MSDVGPSRGSQLLREWQSDASSRDVAELLELDEATYSRFRNGVRKPLAEVGFRIEQLTLGKVPAKSWYEPPRAERRPARSAPVRQRKAKAAS